MKNFWQQLDKPFFCLAPMEAVTDMVFREMFALYGNPEREDKAGEIGSRIAAAVNPFVMFTEFVNVDGLLHAEGYKKLEKDLAFTEKQRPIVAQIWGNNPAKFQEAAKLVAGLGLDGIDINMGCPQDKEIAIGACAALIRQPKLAGEIIEATIKGAGGLPVSVKTRLGYSNTEEMQDWISFLLRFDIQALTLHARTKQEKSKVPAHWDKIKEAVETKRSMKSEVLIVGNGDVQSRQEGLKKVSETGCDGVMIGRAAFGNPWLFFSESITPTIREKLSLMLKHAEMFESYFEGLKPFEIMRKHFKAYASGFPGSHRLKVRLMQTKNVFEARNVVSEFLSGETSGKGDF